MQSSNSPEQVRSDNSKQAALEIIRKVVIEFQKDSIAEWQNPPGKNSDMITLANAFADALVERMEINEKLVANQILASIELPAERLDGPADNSWRYYEQVGFNTCLIQCANAIAKAKL